MNTSPFKSVLAPQLDAHMRQVEISHAERSIEQRKQHLLDFDEYLRSISYQESNPIDIKLVSDWIENHEDLSGRTIMTYVNSLRRFLTFYSVSTGTSVFIPPTYRYDDNYIPYLFSDEEMATIYQYADNYKNGNTNEIPYANIELPIIIRLLDSCGFRLYELISITMKDVDLQKGVLTMNNTKFERHRFVPIAPLMQEQLVKYCTIMGLKMNSQMCLFPGRTPFECISKSEVGARFRKILVYSGIREDRSYDHARGPCIHCLRHRFVVRSIKRMLNQGLCLDDTLPYLSTYLGHKSINETEKYLKFASELFPEELNKFDQAVEKLLPDESIWNDWE